MRSKELSSAKQVQGHGTRQFREKTSPAEPMGPVRVDSEANHAPTGQWPRSHRVLIGLFLLQAAFVCTRIWPSSPANSLGWWPEAILLLLAAVTTVTSLVRELPAQNVLFAVAFIAVVEGVLENVSARTGLPFGRRNYPFIGHLALERMLPWGLGLFWALVLLNARGVARWLLPRWRANANYGFAILSLTTLLVLSVELVLESVAVRLVHCWPWQSAEAVAGWFGIPAQALLGRGLSTLAILALVTPFLISKKARDAEEQHHQRTPED